MKPVSADVYTDFSSLARLKNEARSDSPEVLRKVARQFESVFLQMTMKSMREASIGDDLLNSDKSLFYRDMYDKQLALHLAEESGIGLADMIVRQLGGKEPDDAVTGPGRQLPDYRMNPNFPAHRRSLDHSRDVLQSGRRTGDARMSAIAAGDGQSFGSPESFVETLRPHAVNAARELGVDPGILLAQAALESGWGKRMIRHSDGSNSHNLFGIKADKRWTGTELKVPTLEYVNGIAEKRRETFRSYENYAASFNDYINFIKTNPRYEEALANAGDPRKFMRSLSRAGYATDPDYAEKVIRIFDQHGLARAPATDSWSARYGDTTTRGG